MQELRRIKNTRRNIAWGSAHKAVAILCPFVTRTALIYALGAEYLGISSLYASVLQVLSLAELGFASAVVYSMYKPVAEGDVAQVAAYLNYFKRVYRMVGLAILALGAAAMPLLGFLVKGDWPSDVDMQIAFAIYLANSVIGYFMFAYKQSLLNAYQRNDVISRVNMAVSIAQCVLQVLSLLLVRDFYAFAIAMPLCTVLGNLIVELSVRRLMPEFSDKELCRNRLTDSQRSDVRRRVAGLVMSRVCRATRDSFDYVFVSAFLGLVMVAAYGNYFVVMTGVYGVLGVLNASMTAAVGNSVATETKDKNASDLRLFMFAYSTISTVIAACLLACYQPLITIWVGESLVLPIEVPILMTAYFFVRTMGDMQGIYLNAAGIWWEQRWRTLAEAVSNFTLNWVLVQLLGLPGVILGTLVSLFFIGFMYGSYLTFKNYFGLDKIRAYYLDHALYLAVAVAVCAVVSVTASFIPDGGVWLLVAKALASAFCASALLLAIYFHTKRFRRSVSFAKRVFSREA